MAKTFSKISSIELENFMSISKATLSFDETGIINLKGYNDSGKSAITRALGVLFFNQYKQAQKNFIKHGESFFRIIVNFDDGISILRDKYVHGPSLYEMYENGKLIFSTKVGNTLTQVKEVPLEIREYLAMTETSSGNYLNSQSIYDKQFLIQTSGSENVELLNGVLKLKETSLATTDLKNDINSLHSSINSIVAEIESIKLSLERYEFVDEGFISLLAQLDKGYDKAETLYSSYKELADLLLERAGLSVNTPVLELIDSSAYESLLQISKLLEKVGQLSVAPELQLIDVKSYLELRKIAELQNNRKNYSTLNVELQLIDFQPLNELKNLLKVYEKFSEIYMLNSELTDEANQLKTEMSQLEQYAIEHGIAISRCGNCGSLVQGTAGHVDA